ncbi:MAG: succinyl-CoA synthetase subunit beta, partial [[Candidatus Thermochlorobacteriaceae] bacterium GBChlB]
MNIHEHQGKDILKKFNVPVPKSIVAFTADEAKAAAETLLAEQGGGVVVVKAQIHAGGRGKAGGVKVVKSADDAYETAKKMLGAKL